MRMPRFALRFSTRRLLIAMAVQAALLAVIGRLAGHGRVYEEHAMLRVNAPVDWKVDHYPDDVTYEDIVEHERRLLSLPTLERAAKLLNERGLPLKDVGLDEWDPVTMGRSEMRDLFGTRPDGSRLKYQPDLRRWHYTGAELRKRLRTEIVRTRTEELDSDLPDNAVFVFATSESQGEAKSIACHVVQAYFEVAGEWVWPSSGKAYKIPVPFLDNPWKIAGSILISLLIATVILCYGGQRQKGARKWSARKWSDTMPERSILM
jgi:hypothetical protein